MIRIDVLVLVMVWFFIVVGCGLKCLLLQFVEFLGYSLIFD